MDEVSSPSGPAGDGSGYSAGLVDAPLFSRCGVRVALDGVRFVVVQDPAQETAQNGMQSGGCPHHGAG